MKNREASGAGGLLPAPRLKGLAIAIIVLRGAGSTAKIVVCTATLDGFQVKDNLLFQVQFFDNFLLFHNNGSWLLQRHGLFY
jgi:hypothetical protein